MSDFDFEAALAAQVGDLDAEEPAVSPEEPAAEEPESPADDSGEEAVLEEDSGQEEDEDEDEERPRDDKGRFVPAFNDPDAQSYLENHGGNLSQALRSAAEREQLMGRQAHEIGELRKAIQELQESFVEEPPDEATVIENPAQAAMWALDNRQWDVYERAMSEWTDIDPRAAQRFELMVHMNALRAEMTQTVAPALEPARAQQTRDQLGQARAELKQSYPDIEDVLSTATDAETAGFPQSLAVQMRDGDLDAKREALSVLYRWIKANRPATSATAETRQAKKDAAVATSSSQPARETKDRMELFREAMLAPDPASVLHGLQR